MKNTAPTPGATGGPEAVSGLPAESVASFTIYDGDGRRGLDVLEELVDAAEKRMLASMYAAMHDNAPDRVAELRRSILGPNAPHAGTRMVGLSAMLDGDS